MPAEFRAVEMSDRHLAAHVGIESLKQCPGVGFEIAEHGEAVSRFVNLRDLPRDHFVPRTNEHRLDIERVSVAEEDDHETILFVNEALERLSAQDPTCAQLINLRFFAGLPNDEAARLLGLSWRTAKREWAYARA